VPAILTAQEAEIKGLLLGSPGKKLSSPYLKKKPENKATSQRWRHRPVVPATWKVEVGGSKSEARPKQKVRPYLKTD
jgi:hypothetical protein